MNGTFEVRVGGGENPESGGWKWHNRVEKAALLDW